LSSGSGATPTPFRTNHPGARIWILDDDRALCELLAEQLIQLGWEPCCFHEPAAFEAALTDAPPDLLVLDQMLPIKPGTQVLAKLRARGHRFPVLMLSALGAPTDRVHGLEVGANDYLAKPFLCRELQLRIDQLLSAALATATTAGALAAAADQADTPAYRLASLHFDPENQVLRTASLKLITLSRGDTALLQGPGADPQPRTAGPGQRQPGGRQPQPQP
jgi:DNA-binding response OmpR family regulator